MIGSTSAPTHPIPLPLDWERLLDLARRHRVVPLLYRNLKRIGSPPVPTDVLKRLHGESRANAARNLRLAVELLRLLEVLQSDGIAAIPFKGIALAEAVYGDLSLRDCGDLDLLVRRDDVVRAADRLITLGFRPVFPTSTAREQRYLTALTGSRRDTYLRQHCEHHFVDEPGEMNVDLHWDVALREFAVRLDVEGMWQRAGCGRIAGRPVRSLAAEDLLLVLCINGAKECWQRLQRVCDVAELLHHCPQLDWDQAFQVARRAGAMRMLLIGLRLAADGLDAPLPQNAIELMRRDNRLGPLTKQIVSQLLNDARDSRTSPRVWGWWLQFRLRDCRADQLRYCVAQLRPGVGDWAALPLPPALSFLHYPIRPFRLLARYGPAPLTNGAGRTRKARWTRNWKG